MAAEQRQRSCRCRSGFDVRGDETFAQLVLARIAEPISKADQLHAAWSS